MVRKLLLVLAVLAPLTASAQGDRPAYQDAVPGVPPGFEPMDVTEDTRRIESRRMRELEQQVDTDRYWQTMTSERRIRSRYGAATWNLYEPLH